MEEEAAKMKKEAEEMERLEREQEAAGNGQ
jgi:hypothetical protein